MYPGPFCCMHRCAAARCRLTAKDVHRPTFPNGPDRADALENYPASSRRRHLRQRSPGLKRRVKQAAQSARRHMAIWAGSGVLITIKWSLKTARIANQWFPSPFGPRTILVIALNSPSKARRNILSELNLLGLCPTDHGILRYHRTPDMCRYQNELRGCS